MKTRLALAFACLSACATAPREEAAIQKLTPILVLEAIEPALDFWVDGLGFELTVEVPRGDRLGFAILQQGALEVMLQTKAAALDGDRALADELSRGPTCLYIEVADIDETFARLGAVEVVVPRRETFYGATEIYVRSPGGHVVGLSQQAVTEPRSGG